MTPGTWCAIEVRKLRERSRVRAVSASASPATVSSAIRATARRTARSRRGGAGAACEAPQRGQRRAGAMIAAPQWGQISNPVMRGRVPQPGSRTFKYLVPRPPAQPRLDDVNEV